MSVQAIRLHNLLVFKDSGWFEFRHFTYIYGRNSSGKSAISRAFSAMQKSMNLGIIKSVSNNTGIENYSKLCHKNSENNALSTKIVFEFKCLPRLGLVSKVSEFSKLRGLNLLEENESVIFQISYQKIADIRPDDFGVICSISIKLFESRTIKDETSGNWADKKIIIDIYRDNLNAHSWIFESDFLDIGALNALLEEITLDEDKPIPYLKAKEGDLYRLLEFSSDELENEENDPYKNPDNPKNVIRYLDHFLKDLSSDIIGFIDSIKFIEPVIRGSQALQMSIITDDKHSQISETIQSWGSNFPHNVLSKVELEHLIENLLNGDLVSRLDLSLGLGQLNSTRMLLDLLLLERDNIVFIRYPDMFLDVNNQLELADLLTICAIKDEKKVIVETHSEYLLLRIKKRLRQINDQRLPEKLNFLTRDFKFNNEKVGILFCIKTQEGASKCQTISLDENGEFVEPWPGGFYEEGTFERFDS